MSYDENNIFAKILRKEIPADVIHEDDQCLVFNDAAPQAPTHFLVVPKEPMVQLADAEEDDRALLGHMLWVAAEVARKQGLEEGGFRVVINNGAQAGQSVFHLHVHVLGGREMSWPPG